MNSLPAELADAFLPAAPQPRPLHDIPDLLTVQHPQHKVKATSSNISAQFLVSVEVQTVVIFSPSH